MGAQQILREPGRLVAGPLVALALALSTGAARADSAAPSIPVVIVDLRPGDAGDRRASRDAFARELGTVQGVDLVADPELAGALVGEAEPPIDRDVRKRATDHMSTLLTKRDSGECAGVESAKATADLAALEAGGRRVGPELTLAYVFELRCAHAARDTLAAAHAARMLRALGHVDAPPEVDPAIWAANSSAQAPAATTTVRIASVPAGADIWVDHQRIGPSPVELTLSQGTHVIAAGGAEGVGAEWVTLRSGAETVAVEVERTPRRWAGVRSMVASWRGGSAGANALAIARLMTETGVRYAVLLSDGDRAELWRLPDGASAAERVRQATLRAPQVIGGALSEAAGTSPPADAGVPILVEDAKNKDERKRQKWWVYAGIIGAVAVGAGIILANDLADDRQRIELTWP